MGTSKSFRMSDRIENMFNSIKKVNESSSDTDILSYGIEKQFEDESEIYNYNFRKNITNYISNNSLNEIFLRLCDMLEPMSYADGFFLEDEVIGFMSTIEADCFFSFVERETSTGDFQKYSKVYKMLIKSYNYKEEDFQELAKKLDNFYEQKK